MATNMTLEQLVSQAKQTADLRCKIMNDLRQHIENVLIPAVSEVLTAYGVEALYVKSSEKLITSMNKKPIPDAEPSNDPFCDDYCYMINADGTISHCYLDLNEHGEVEWYESGSNAEVAISDCTIPKRNLADFAEHVKGALQRLNERMHKQIEAAQRAIGTTNNI